MNHLFLLTLTLLFLSSCSDTVVETPNTPQSDQIQTPETVETPVENIQEWETPQPEEASDSNSEESSVVDTTPKQPQFSKIDIDFEHIYDKEKALAFVWWTFFDLDGDGNNEILITGWAEQTDWVFEFKDGALKNITIHSWLANRKPSYWAYSIDFDENGTEDLFIARQDGIYYYNNDSGDLKVNKLEISLPLNAVPLDIDLADIDNDGDLDMYVSTFITQSLFKAATFNNPDHVQKNLLLRNDENLKFTDITEESGVKVIANTFTSSFADLDNDNDPDLIISPNTDTVKIFQNDDGKFTPVYTWEAYGFWMWLSINDYDNDGDLDIFFSNVWRTIPEALLAWDSTKEQDVTSKYLFLENNWGMKFKQKVDPSFDELWFGWWIVPVDVNLDAQTDYIVTQNYIKWAPHKLSKLTWELLVQNNKNTFTPSMEAYDISNKHYGISALVWDINNDTFQDIIYLNLDWKPQVYLREPDENNNFLRVQVPNKKKYLHAIFSLLAWEEVLSSQQFLPKQWLMTKQESSITFWLNWFEKIPTQLQITLQNGEKQIIDLIIWEKEVNVK